MTLPPLLPPIGPWSSVHPVIVHLPIGILVVSGIWVGLGVLPSAKLRALDLCGLILAWVGTIAAWVTVEAGEAAAAVAPKTDEIAAAIGRHAFLADLTRGVFAALAVLYAIVVLVPRLRKKELPPVAHVLVRGAFGLLYLGGIILIAWTGHRGGVLVHVLGVRALIPQ